jgi:hypothetical protein
MIHLQPIHRRSLSLLLAFLALMLFAGCQKSANQPATSSNNPSSPADSAQNSQTQPGGPTTPPPPIVVPAGTSLSVVLDQTISSKTASSGQTFSASVHAPVAVDGIIVIPKGAHVTGVVKDAKAAGRFKGGSSLELALSSINIDGTEYHLDTSVDALTHKGKGKRTAGMVGGGGAGGALIGGLAGGGKGALIGVLVGAGAGTAGSAFTGKNDIVLTPETPLTFRLHQPVEIASH